MSQTKSTIRAVVIGLLATVLVEIVRRSVLIPVFGFSPKVMPAILSVILAAWFGGAQAGWIASVLNVAKLWGYHGGEIHFEPLAMDHRVRLVMLLAIGGIISWVIGALRTARQRAEDRQRELEIETIERRNVEETSRTNASRLQAILDNTSAVIYVKDLQGQFLLINKRFEALSSHDAIVGKSDADLFPSDVVATIHAHDRQVRETAQPLEFEEIVPQRDGLHTYVAVKFPIFDSAGQVAAIGGISTDISERKKAVDALEAERELLKHTIEVQDQERQLVAYEIHDGLVQYVTGALMQLEAMQDRDVPLPTEDALESVVGILRRAVAEGRRLINGIRTPVLDGLGVLAALEQLIQEEERAHVQVEFVKDAGIERMDSKVEEAIYRITQEALTNVEKHSQSKTVRIKLGRQGDKVHLEIRDWGAGFVPSNGVNGVHGLRGMMERARIVGGECIIESAPGNGTRVLADLPYLGRN